MRNKLTFSASIIVMLLFLSCIQNSDNKTSTLSAPPSPADVNPLVVSNSPLLVSNDFGKTWTPLSDGLPSEIQASFLEKMGDEMVLATNNFGIYQSINNGSEWKSISEEIPSKKINALHVSEGDIYAGVYRQGIYLLKEGGKSWEAIHHNLKDLNVQAILKLENQLLVGNDKGVFVLNGKQWEETSIKNQVLSLYEYTGKVVAGTSVGTAISEDSGKSWKWVRQEGAVHYTHNIKERIVELQLNGDVVYSDDWGENWTTTQYSPREEAYVYEIIQAGDYFLMSNNYGILRSKDKGRTWEHIYKTESVAFLDLISIGNKVYGCTRTWDEYRKRRKQNTAFPPHSIHR